MILVQTGKSNYLVIFWVFIKTAQKQTSMSVTSMSVIIFTYFCISLIIVPS